MNQLIAFLNEYNIPLWGQLLLGIGFSIFGIFLTFFYEAVRGYLIERKHGDISGEWDSYWETMAIDQEKWIHEVIRIKKNWGKYKFDVSNNSEGYNWVGLGKFNSPLIFLGHWKVLKKGAHSKGGIALYRNSEGDFLIGHWFGPSGYGIPTSGRWVMVRKGNDCITPVKIWFGKRISNSLKSFLEKRKEPILTQIG